MSDDRSRANEIPGRSPDEAGTNSPEPAVAEIARRLGAGVLYPLSYSIPAALIVDQVPIKQEILAGAVGRIAPAGSGPKAGYRFGPGEQEAYYQHYRESCFAETCRKGGWDCLRHLEIMMNGALPLFADIERCPALTMAHYPKQRLLEIRERHAPMLAAAPDSVDGTDLEVLRRDVDELLAFTRRHLTTEAMARWFLDRMGAAAARSVLFLTRVKKPDYLCEMLLHGLRSVLGDGLVDVDKRWWLYGSAPVETTGRLYGNGFTYTRHLEDLPIDRAAIASRIRNREFDLVVFGNIERGTPHLPLVRKHYARQEIAVIDGGDHDLFPGQPGRTATRRPWRDRLGVPDRDLAGAGVIFKREISEETLRAFESGRAASA